MAKKNRQKSVKAILLFTILALLFYLPLKAEDEDHKADRVLIKSIKPENNMNELSFMSLGSKPSENSESMQNAIKEYKPYSTRLSFSRTPDESYPALKKDSHKRVNPKSIENLLFTTSLATLVALNVGDFYTTNKALKYKGLKEANPLLGPLTKNTLVFATVKFGITAINYHLLKKLHRKNKMLAWAVSIASNLVMGYIIINNARLIKNAQGAELM
jgi:hypothetical protein